MTTPETDQTPGVESEQDPGATPGDDHLGEGGRKALEAERKARRDAECELRELKERLAGIDAETLRRDVAEAKGLTPDQARRLNGTTREELEADADDLLAAIRPGGATPPTRRPVPDLRGGIDPTDDVQPSPSAIADQILRRTL